MDILPEEVIAKKSDNAENIDDECSASTWQKIEKWKDEKWIKFLQKMEDGDDYFDLSL